MIQCHARVIPSLKVHGYSEVAIVYSNLGECYGIFTTCRPVGFLFLK